MATPPSEAAFAAGLAAVERHAEGELGFALSPADRAELKAMLRTFHEEQLEIRFRSHRRPWARYHPSYRRLLQETSPSGRHGHFLASREDYAFVRDLSRAGRLVPVVGDFAGETALAALGARLRARGETLSAFYLSNVEFYLVRQGALARFARNLRSLPADESSLLIRACFDYGRPHPAGMPGHRSTTLLQRVERFLELERAGSYAGTWDVCTLDYLRPE